MDDLSKDTQAQGYFTSLLNIALNHNAAVIEQATHALSAGPLKQSSRKQVMQNFKKIHADAEAQFKQVMQEYEKQLGDKP